MTFLTHHPRSCHLRNWHHRYKSKPNILVILDTCTYYYWSSLTPARGILQVAKMRPSFSLHTIPTLVHSRLTIMFSFSTSRFVLLVAAACNAVTSAEPTVVLGEAGEFVILAKTGISTVPNSAIIGDIGVSPIPATAMTGFSLTMDSLSQFSTSVQVSANSNHPGHAYAASYGTPISERLTTAVSAMETAYTDAAGRDNPDGARINLGGGTLGGDYGGPEHPLTPGVYTFGTDVLLANDVFFSGAGVFIIQMTGNLIQAANYNVILSNNATATDIFWQVAGEVTVAAGAHMEGIILVKTKADFLTGSSLNGRVLTQTACNLQMATITEPVIATVTEAEGGRTRRGLRSR